MWNHGAVNNPGWRQQVEAREATTTGHDLELQLSTYFSWGFLGVEDPAWWKSPHKPTATLAQGESASGSLEMGFSALATQFVRN